MGHCLSGDVPCSLFHMVCWDNRKALPYSRWCFKGTLHAEQTLFCPAEALIKTYFLKGGGLLIFFGFWKKFSGPWLPLDVHLLPWVCIGHNGTVCLQVTTVRLMFGSSLPPKTEPEVISLPLSLAGWASKGTPYIDGVTCIPNMGGGKKELGDNFCHVLCFYITAFPFMGRASSRQSLF